MQDLDRVDLAVLAAPPVHPSVLRLLDHFTAPITKPLLQRFKRHTFPFRWSSRPGYQVSSSESPLGNSGVELAGSSGMSSCATTAWLMKPGARCAYFSVSRIDAWPSSSWTVRIG